MATEEIGVEVSDDLLHCPFGRGDDSMRASEKSHLGLEEAKILAGIAEAQSYSAASTNTSPFSP